MVSGARAQTGSFCLVLHGHLPWVLHHGRWPHGEDWLYEAAARTWMPLLGVLERLQADGIEAGWTIGMTPILLEQLAADRFKDGFERYLVDRGDRARRDEHEWAGRDEGAHRELAASWIVHHEAVHGHFLRIDRSIPEAMSRVRGIELLSSNATHAFHPLILHDACARAQLRCGFSASERHLHRRPRGMWLPECAYRPPGPWTPPLLHADERQKAGVAQLAEGVGCRYFFVDTHLVERCVPVAQLHEGHLVEPDRGDRGWREVTEPHRVAEDGALTDITVLARCPDVSEQVWSGKIGYPGDGRYREFHKVHGMRGLHYWRVTHNTAPLNEKEPYDPAGAADAVRDHAEHFVSLLHRRLASHQALTGRGGIVCAPFDAELFGHWWYEGPAFLEAVARRLAVDPGVRSRTVEQALAEHPADKVAALPEGTWGAGGDTQVWFNDELRFYWEIAWRAEDRFLDLWHRVHWAARGPGTRLLEEAGRQLLLLQSSDWPFVIHTRGAVDYGLRRILDHASRFDDLCNGVEDELSGQGPDPVVVETVQRCQLLDPVFPDLDLAWWG